MEPDNTNDTDNTAANTSPISAIGLNCTLKKSPEISHSGALLDKVMGLLDHWGAETEVLRVVDHDVPFGVSSDEGSGDDWPMILDKLKAADILIMAMPIWFGVRSSVAQLVIERLDGTYREEMNDKGQFPLYNKVAGVVVTGNEDGAHDASATTLFNLSHLGYVVPPNSDCYWVGEAGPGPSYLDAGGPNHLYTNRGARLLAYNCFQMAETMRLRPFKTNFTVVQEEAIKQSMGAGLDG